MHMSGEKNETEEKQRGWNAISSTLLIQHIGWCLYDVGFK